MHFRKGLWILLLEERNFNFCQERITITTTWHQPDVSFETHWNSFKQKCTREHPIKERNWIWRLGKVTQTIEEKNYEDIPLNILAKLIKESHNNERQENTKCNFTNDRRQTAENESDLKNDGQNDRQQ